MKMSTDLKEEQNQRQRNVHIHVIICDVEHGKFEGSNLTVKPWDTA